jgi:hypothetical protein
MDNTVLSNQELIERNRIKKFSLKKSITYINVRPRTTENLFDESFTDLIQTNLERMISNLGGIKKKMLLIQDLEMGKQIDWMIDTLLKNQLNDIVVKLETNNTNSLDIEKMLELLAEFSSEFNLKRNIETLQLTLMSKKHTMKLNSECDDLGNSVEKILANKFDIFNLTEDVGRENVLKIIAGSLFKYFSLFDKIALDKFFNFIEEIRTGYKRTNFYHNVTKLII